MPSAHRLVRAVLVVAAVSSGALPAFADEPLTSRGDRPIMARPLDGSWELASRRQAHGFVIERYVQRIDGVRVDGAHAVVRARRDGVVDLVRVETPFGVGARAIGGAPRSLGPELLASHVGAQAVGFAPVSFEDLEPVLAARSLHESPAVLVRAHRVTVRGASLDERVSLVLDDATLAVLRVEPLVVHARGLVYPRNAVSDASMTTEVELPAQTDPDTLTSTAFTVRSCVVSSDGACTPIARATPDMEGNFLLAPEPSSFEDGFTEVMAYYHASLLADRLERDHGFRWECATVSGGSDSMRIFTNFTDAPGRPYANAAFVGGTRSECAYLLFGQSGTQDFASDADVVYHELGHAVTDQLSDIVGFGVDALGMHYDPLAVNEGTSDYWAATAQGDPHVGESLEGLDGIGRSAALRDLDGALRCPDDLFGEGHFDGRIWAGAFWDLRTELGESKVDALLFTTIASSGTASTLRAAGEIAVSTADSLAVMGTLSTAEAARVREVLTERGLLDCRRITPLDDEEERIAFSGLALFTGGLGNDVAPVHYSLTLPADATSATLEIRSATATGNYAILARGRQPVGFRGTGVQFDQRDEVGRDGTVVYRPSSAAFAPCDTLYLAIETTDLDRGESLYLVRGRVERSGDPSARCPEPEPDAGARDARVEPDAGPVADDAGMPGSASGDGCGCRAGRPRTSGLAASLAALGLFVVASRRRRPRR